MDKATQSDGISGYFEQIIADERVLEEITATLRRGAVNSGEAEESDDGIDKWFASRFLQSSVVLSKDDYSRALIRSLWIAPNLAALDFAGGRLRDFAQLWTDTARGFLGEIAVQRFLKEKFDFDTFIETRRGKVEEFMPSDVLVLEKGSAKPRASKIRISVKTTKFNGRWLEIPDSQFKQSDVFVFVKLGISRFHFSSYLKDLKTLKQLFETGSGLKELDDGQIQILSKEIPDWTPIPAYVSGFVSKGGLKQPIDAIEFRTPRRQKKNPDGIRPISRIEIEKGVGLFSREAVQELREVTALQLPPDIPIRIAGIEKDADGNFYASSGLLRYNLVDWKALVAQL